jgi:hypothetical protein
MKGSEFTLARYWSRKAVIRRMLSQGLKVQTIEPEELAKAARAYLDQHPELVIEANVVLQKI